MSSVQVLGVMGNSLLWKSAQIEPRAWSGAQKRPVRPGNAWLSAEEVALMVLAGECKDAGVSVPAQFSKQAIESAVCSVERWRDEGRVFAIHDLYPRYQFDGRGHPIVVIERVLAVLGTDDPLRVGNWFSAPHRHLMGRRPQELLAVAPTDVLHALDRTARELHPVHHHHLHLAA